MKGQVQYVDRTGGTGQGQTIRHGEATCLEAVEAGEQGAGIIGGRWRDGGTFEIYVEDNGEGNGAEDMILIDQAATLDCEQDDNNGEPTALSRGNVQVHNAPEE